MTGRRRTLLGWALGLLALATACESKQARRGALGAAPGDVKETAPAEAPGSMAQVASEDAGGSGGGPAVAAAAPAEAPRCDIVPRALRRAAARRVVAIGDIHGDVAALASALRAAKAIDKEGGWIGGDLVVVQTGDLLDRGDDEQAIIDWLEQLEAQAEAAGGALVWLLGNHELMNAAGDLRYVTPGGFRDFEDVKGLPLASFGDVPAPARARVAAFAPGAGPYARILSGQDTVVIIGETVFSHAGVTEPWASRLEEVNQQNRCYLSGAGQAPAALVELTSPVWTRDWGGAGVDCAALTRALAALGASRMVVGHTTQPSGISSACNDTLWRIDVGLGVAYGGPIEVLEIDRKGARVLRGTR